MATMRYRPPSSSPGAKRPCDRELDDVRLARRGALLATVCVANESAPQDAQIRPAP
jgi:hypothetical protein